ncbi:MAG TPA: hypothetical protein PLX35_04935 [Cyclobacteriaceae bacterium]|nr:hypothetical protein [Cyclobacteriaceae bacterium]
MRYLQTAIMVLSAWSYSLGQASFPDRCIGIWTGTMHIYRQGTLQDSVNVVLTVARHADTGAWTWKTEYLSKTRPMTKDYVLRLKDEQKGVYVTDEGGGIELIDYLFGNKLYSAFETHDVLLTSSYELINDQLIFEVCSGKKPATATPAPEVINYPVINLQRVVFRRK